MLKFETLYKEGHEEVVFFSDPSCNLKVIIAIHNSIVAAISIITITIIYY